MGRHLKGVTGTSTATPATAPEEATGDVPVWSVDTTTFLSGWSSGV